MKRRTLSPPSSAGAKRRTLQPPKKKQGPGHEDVSESDSDSLARIAQGRRHLQPKGAAGKKEPSRPGKEPLYAVYKNGDKPMGTQESYAILEGHVEKSLNKEAAAAVPSGAVGATSAQRVAYLIREINTKGPVEPNLPRVETTLINPIEDTFLRRITTMPANSAAHLNPDTLAFYRSQLIPSRRAHEERMLRSPLPGIPKCANEDRCKGNKIACAGGGATLMAYYTEPEWSKYQNDLRNGVPSTRLPDLKRECILCMRYDVNRYVVNLRAENLALRHDKHHPCVGKIYNLVDVEGEYRMEDCIVSPGHVYEGIVHPIVKPSLLCFEAYLDKQTGAKCFRQLLPYYGETQASSSSSSSSSSSASANASGF